MSRGCGQELRVTDGADCTHYPGMGVVVQSANLRTEMARRGWSAADLARQSGVSAPTISAALAGRAIAARSLAMIADCLDRSPPIGAIDALIAGGWDL